MEKRPANCPYCDSTSIFDANEMFRRQHMWYGCAECGRRFRPPSWRPMPRNADHHAELFAALKAKGDQLRQQVNQILGTMRVSRAREHAARHPVRTHERRNSDDRRAGTDRRKWL